MENKNFAVLGIILGDHAGSSPELAAMTVLKNEGTYIPVLIGNRERFEISCESALGGNKLTLRELKEKPLKWEKNVAYFCDIPAGSDIHFATITADSGELQYQSIKKTVELEKAGIIDGFLMAPITKEAFHAAGYKYSSEFELFAELYNVAHCASVIKSEDIFRSTVVGHCAFKEIVERLSTEGIVNTGKALLEHMGIFMPKEKCKIAVAALNPHAGENGLFGDEEQTVIQPAIDKLLSLGHQVIGPCPADTVFLKALSHEVGGVVFLYHDQGNIAMKSCSFGSGVLIYTGLPANVVSVGHGPAYDKAGKGTADPNNMLASIDTLYTIVSGILN